MSWTNQKQLDLVKGKLSDVVFVDGLQCEYFIKQVRLVDERLGNRKVNLVIITSEENPRPDRRHSVDCPVTSDPENNWAGWFRMMYDGPAHGTCVLGANGDFKLSSTEDTPYMDVETPLDRLQKMNETAASNP